MFKKGSPKGIVPMNCLNSEISFLGTAGYYMLSFYEVKTTLFSIRCLVTNTFFLTLKTNFNEKTDIWSCGVIFFQLITGELPFKGNNIKELIANINKGNIDLNKGHWIGISSEIKILISSLFNFFSVILTSHMLV